MKTLTITLTLLLFAVFTNAQDIVYKSTRSSQYNPTISKELHKISILPLGYAYERQIAEEFTFEAGIDFAADSYYASWDDFDNYTLVINPKLHFEPRYYYNMKKRFERGKNVNFNAANYIGLYSVLVMNPIIEEINGFYPIYDRFKIGPVWGIQRNLGRRGYLNFSIAYGLVIDENSHARTEGFGRLTLGLRINGTVEK